MYTNIISTYKLAGMDFDVKMYLKNGGLGVPDVRRMSESGMFILLFLSCEYENEGFLCWVVEDGCDTERGILSWLKRS